jgi:hypothetical protein
MSLKLHLKENYNLARCCSPKIDDQIAGYYSYDNELRVHRIDCANLQKVDPERIVRLEWQEILAEPGFYPDDDVEQLDAIDFRILHHHREYGIDYSHVVARALHIEKQEAFDRHHKLKTLGLLRRVDPTMIQYRKGVVDNKWIKHRNHTYYELTGKGLNYLEWYLSRNPLRD